MRILTGIVTFNPNIDRLRENLKTVTVQDTEILIFDNGSENYKGIENLVSEFGCEIYRVKENKGIAYGLKYIMDYAILNKYEWVLSLDQDSVSDAGIISEYKKYVNNPKIGALTCIIRDRNFVEINKPSCSGNSDKKLKNVQKCITSGCFMRVSAYALTDGYDTSMFIDFVDFDICYAIIRAGYKIVQIPYEGLLHEDGHGANISFWGRKYIMYHKSAWRRFYMVRNEIYVARKFPEIQSPFHTIVHCLWQIFLVLIYEEDKLAKLRSGLKGLFAGMIMDIPANTQKSAGN